MKVFNTQPAIRHKSATQLNTLTYCGHEKTRHPGISQIITRVSVCPFGSRPLIHLGKQGRAPSEAAPSKRRCFLQAKLLRGSGGVHFAKHAPCHPTWRALLEGSWPFAHVAVMAVIRGCKPHGQRGLGCLGERVIHGQNLKSLRRNLNPRGLALRKSPALWATRLINWFLPAEFCSRNKATKKGPQKSP
jgi:hypothetical protein